VRRGVADARPRAGSSPTYDDAPTPLAALFRAGAQLPSSKKLEQDVKKPRNLIAVSIFVALLARVAWSYMQESQAAKRTQMLLELIDGAPQVVPARSSDTIAPHHLQRLAGALGDGGAGADPRKLRQVCRDVVDLSAVAEQIRDISATRGSVWFDVAATLLVGVGLSHIVFSYDQLERRWAASSFRSAVQVSKVQNKCKQLKLQVGIFARTRERLEGTIASVQAASAGDKEEREAELRRLRAELETVQKQEAAARKEMEEENKELASKASLAKNKMERVMSCVKGIDAFHGAGKNKFAGHGAARGFSGDGFSMDVITFGTIEDGELLMYETARSRKIGEGVDGAYKCTDLSTGEEYALKMYPIQSHARGAAILNDLRAHRSQVGKHPNVVNYLRVIESENAIFVIMELLKGKDLFNVVVEDGLTEETARPLFRELVLALQHLHTKNVIHCDIKPENAFVTGRPGEPDCQLTLIDFGASCFPEADRSRTGANIIYDVYMPPEHAQNPNLPPTRATDLWRLGCTLYVILTGGMPFHAYQRPVSQACLEARKEGKFYAGAPYSELSADAKDLVQKLLSGDPRQRPSCEDILQHQWLTRK